MSQITILKAEDCEPSGDAVSELLRREGFTVVDTRTGEEALQLVKTVQPQLVLLAVSLPHTNGHEVCRQLKGDSATARIPVVQVSSAFANGEDRVRGLQSGADAYLVKPFEPEELISTIRALLRMGEAEEARRESEARYQLLFAEREELLVKEQRAREEAQAANRSKDEFLGLVSHELRAPLNAMVGWARILRSTRVDQATMTHAIEIIERSARTQSKLIEDLLDTARIATGKLRLEIQPVDLSGVVNAAVEVLKPAAEAKGIEMNVVLDAPREVIAGDPDRLQQIVGNLVFNAIKFTPDEGRIEVRLLRADPHVRITVSDTGRGISPEAVASVFESFYQAHSSSTRRHGGLGLGLSLVRHLVELHGGTVYAESPGEGQGATFTVNLPLRAVRPNATGLESMESTDASAALHSALGGVWVLVVDDEADARELISLLLRQYGAEVTSVASADDAMVVLTADAEGARPDVLVSDISMPGEDGYSLIQRVRELAPERGGRMPAVAVTAFGRSVDRIRALSGGFQLHIPKPVDPVELATVIASLMGRSVKGMKA